MVPRLTEINVLWVILCKSRGTLRLPGPIIRCVIFLVHADSRLEKGNPRPAQALSNPLA